MFHDNRLLAYDSREIACLILLKIMKDAATLVVCFSRD